MSPGGTVRFEGAISPPRRTDESVSSLLVEAARELTEPQGGLDALEHACHVAHRPLDADLVVLFESSDQGRFRTLAQYGLSEDTWAQYQTVELSGEIADVIRERLALGSVPSFHVAKPGKTPDDMTRRSIARKLGFGPLLLLGLRTAGVLTGLVVACRERRKDPFDARDVEIAEGLAPLLAATLRTEQRVRRLHATNQAQAEFLAGMAHELRAPLHVIMGYLDVLLDDPCGALNVEQRGICDRIHAAAMQQLSLVRETFEMSRRDEAGRMPVREAVVDVGRFAAELEYETTLRPRPAGVDVTWNVSMAGRRIMTDPVKLGMIVRNLVDNAVKFTRKGEVSVTLDLTDDTLVCRVRDTGVGIPPAEREAIFEAFRQIDGPRPTGLGLGLYIVRRVVDVLEGEVEVESTVGVGSTFTVRVPVRPADPA